jgi:hypothetical protein
MSNAAIGSPQHEAQLDAQERLFRRLGYTGPSPTVARGANEGLVAGVGGGSGAEPAPLDLLGVEVLKEGLRANPEEVLARARKIWDQDLTREELESALDGAERLLIAPDLGIKQLDANEGLARKATPLPPEFFEEWYDKEIPIDPASTKFETKADAINWVIFGGPALLSSMLGKKAPFEWHQRYASGFVYQREAPSAPLPIALLSDFGTGLYHSNYIAKQIAEKKYGYVVHGGDVYYAGRDSEFRTNFRPQTERILKSGSQLFTMNANHEMYSLGKPYFQYLKERRTRHPEQLQEGSYFSLRFGDTAQIVGIDTAYFRDGRHDEPGVQRWLKAVLLEGRRRGMVNILFSPNEPYSYGSTSLTSLLTEDLQDVAVNDKLVDLWFWGNTHYCALFDKTPGLPFYGSCIGHGGYPYSREKQGKPSAAPVKFLEVGARFPSWTGVRQDRGNNGYCELTIHPNHSIDLQYIDWMTRKRCRAQFVMDSSLKMTSIDA